MITAVPQPLLLGMTVELDALLAACSGILFVVILLSLVIYAALVVRRHLRRRANQFGYEGILAYLRAVPRDEAEKRDAVDLAMIGVVLCLLGFAFFLLLLIGIFPLYYGVRKLLLIAMGIGPGLPPAGP
jgi:hypothetical protein